MNGESNEKTFFSSNLSIVHLDENDSKIMQY